jgi:cystathionine beta-synthase
VVGVGSSGTITGLSRFFSRVRPRRGVEMILADPEGSILAEYTRSKTLGEAGSWAVEGIGEDFIPDIADLSFVTEAFSIPDVESFTVARELLRKEGILGGSSTGTLVAAALRYCRKQTKKRRVVTFICDTGNKYLSKMYNDFWMAEQGFLPREEHGDLRDLIARRYEAREVISVKPDDTLLLAYGRMRGADVSQVPVLDENDRAVGILDESDLLMKVHSDPSQFKAQVRSAMTDKLETLAPTAKFEEVIAVFDRGRVAILMDGAKFLGLITRTDLLSYLRLRMPK